MSWDAIRLQNTIQVLPSKNIALTTLPDHRPESLPRRNVDIFGNTNRTDP